MYELAAPLPPAPGIEKGPYIIDFFTGSCAMLTGDAAFWSKMAAQSPPWARRAALATIAVKKDFMFVIVKKQFRIVQIDHFRDHPDSIYFRVVTPGSWRL
jgi:hypothetical protein